MCVALFPADTRRKNLKSVKCTILQEYLYDGLCELPDSTPKQNILDLLATIWRETRRHDQHNSFHIAICVRGKEVLAAIGITDETELNQLFEDAKIVSDGKRPSTVYQT